MRIVALGESMIELSDLGEGNIYRAGFAGDTLNTAWYLKALAPQDWTIAYYTVVGGDTQSDAMVDFIAQAGIDVDMIARHPSRGSGLYMISLNNGERSFSYWRDTSAAKTLADDVNRLENVFVNADVIYFSGITIAIIDADGRDNLISALEDAKNDGKTIIFDPNIRPRLWANSQEMVSTISRFAAVSSWVLPSFDDEAAHFGDLDLEGTAKRYQDSGVSEVVVKNGGGDMLVADAQGLSAIAALERMQPVDTTGAGDSFNGGYIIARLLGHDMTEAVSSGHKMASQVVMQRGALMAFEDIK